MIELQEHQFCECNEFVQEYRGPLSNEMRPYYLKSEADKVIADLEESHKMEVEQLLMEIVKLKAQKAQAEDDCAYWKAKAQRERHHKFKRCCEEAKICQLRLERYEQYVTKYKDCKDPTIQRWKFLKDHYEKWHLRWLKISEQFKEAK